MATLQGLEAESLKHIDDAARALRLLGWHVDRLERMHDRGFALHCIPPHVPGTSQPPIEGNRRGG